MKFPYPESGVRILSVVFGEEWTEVSWVEERDESDDVVDIHQRLIKPYLFKDEVDEVKESISDLLDQAAVHRRNPTPSYSRRLEDND